MKRYFVTARHYFDKTYGNSYHTVEIYDNTTGDVTRSKMIYGHGEAMYAETAIKTLGLPTPERGERMKEIALSVTTVQRIKDLQQKVEK